MAFEVDFLPFEGERSGDAIVLRWGDVDSVSWLNQRIAVIDGGFKSTGEQLVDHVRNQYSTERVDIVISTHPDADHVNGLHVVLEELDVDLLLMHLPWDHTDDIASLFKDGRVTDDSVSDHLRLSLEGARSLEDLARSKGIEITEPFAGARLLDGAIEIVGPTVDYYESLLPGFRGTPVAEQTAGLVQRATEFMKRLAESFDVETLTDDGSNSAENETSAVTLFRDRDHQVLFTADAGIDALNQVADRLGLNEYEPSDFHLIQVPHHGSRHNVGPSLLNRLVGPKRSTDEKLFAAMVSAATESAPRHPAKQVTNAFRRRGAPVWGPHDHGKTVCHHSSDAPPRPGWSPIDPLPLYPEVED